MMLTKKSLIGLGLSVGLTLAVFVTGPVQFISYATAEDVPVFTPLVDSAPTRRIGGGSRGASGEATANVPLPTLAVLVPTTTGFTINPQPSLYWSVSKVLDKPFKFTLIYADNSNPEPVLEVVINKPSEGIQAVDLAKQGVTLKPDVEYQWSLSIVMNPKEGSQDIISVGTIKRIEAPAGLTDNIAKADAMQHPFIYAKAGVWYDAIASLSSLIDKNPSDQTLRKQRTALLQQVGLKVEKAGTTEVVVEATQTEGRS